MYTCKFIDDQLCGNYDSHEKHLSIKSWNVNGLAQKLRDPDFSNLIHNYGIVYLTKKWITSNSCVYLELPDFDCVHLYRNSLLMTDDSLLMMDNSLLMTDDSVLMIDNSLLMMDTSL